MSALADARTVLHDALVSTKADRQWRVHAVTPDAVVAPCLFLGGASLMSQVQGSPGISLIVATFPIYLVADGAPAQQTRTLDEMIAVAWDACLLCGAEPDVARPAPIDVGGPNLRGAVVQCDMTLRALTLCTPTLEAAHG